MFNLRVNNVPDYAKEHEYIVVRIFDREAWFYGAYDSESRANAVAEEIDGLVLENKGE